MSWAEVEKKLSIERDTSYSNMYVYENSATFTAPKTGYYKIICVGAGGAGATARDTSTALGIGGCSGGVAIKTKKMAKGATLSITISSDGTASCDGMSATKGYDRNYYPSRPDYIVPGTATGGDYNYNGQTGTAQSQIGIGGSVGCILSGLMTRDVVTTAYNGATRQAYSGWGIFGHGGGASRVQFYDDGAMVAYSVSQQQPAGVIIIPLPALS